MAVVQLLPPGGCNIETIAASEIDLNYINQAGVFVEIFFKQEVAFTALPNECVVNSIYGQIPLSQVMGPVTGEPGHFVPGEYVVVLSATSTPPANIPPSPGLPAGHFALLNITATAPPTPVWCYEWGSSGGTPICDTLFPSQPMGGMSLLLGPANPVITATCPDSGDPQTCSNDAGQWTLSNPTPGGPNFGSLGPLGVKMFVLEANGGLGTSWLVVGFSMLTLVAVVNRLKKKHISKIICKPLTLD